jgi:hypothetical protein
MKTSIITGSVVALAVARAVYADCPCEKPAYISSQSACLNCCTSQKNWSGNTPPECSYVEYPALVTCDCNFGNQTECIDTGSETANMTTIDYHGTCSVLPGGTGYGGCSNVNAGQTRHGVKGKDKRDRGCPAYR